MIRKIAVVAITRHGIDIAHRIKEKMPEVEIYAPAKHSNSTSDINWFTEQTAQSLVANLFKTSVLICIFSLGER